MALVAPTLSDDRRRVKVYELRNNDWFDRGTGFCMGRLLDVSSPTRNGLSSPSGRLPSTAEMAGGRGGHQSPITTSRAALLPLGLTFVANSPPACSQDDPRIYVESEEQPELIILETRISRHEGYQKQQDTLIVWTEPTGTNMALSFQEADGCSAIWDFVENVQQQLLALSGQDDALSDDAIEAFSNPLRLPLPELGNLPDIEQMTRSASTSQHGRESLAKFIVSEEYIPKLVPLVAMAEDLESLADLHRLCNIVKTLILLNDTAIIELVVTEELIFGIVGALEYDPEFPKHKANHRQYLKDESRFREVVPFEDATVIKKIHRTYRLQYLKDVVLARILDDPTFSVLNSLIFFNQVDIVQYLQSDAAFQKELFEIFSTPQPDERRKNAVHFIQTCCAIAKNLQAPIRLQLYTSFIQSGLFKVIDFALRHPDAPVRIAGTDVLVAMIDHDAQMMRALVVKQVNDGVTPLTDNLIEFLLREADMGVKAQIADAIKVLLDPQHSNTLQADGAGKAASMIQKLTAQADPKTEVFLINFYKFSAPKLFKPLMDLEHRDSMRNLSIQEVSLYSHLVEILCFFIRQHIHRGKLFVLTGELTSRIAQLFACPEKHLKLIALKFFRICIGMQDEHINRHMMSKNHFDPILDILIDTMPKDNLLNSACLELFEFIKRESVGPLILHLVEFQREKIRNIRYVDTFQNLMLRYEQMLNYHADTDSSQAEHESGDVGANIQVNGGRRWQGIIGMDPTEEEYFNTSDDEDEPLVQLRKSSPRLVPLTDTPRLLKPLVDYPDDDDDDDGDNVSENLDATAANAQLPLPPTLPTTSTASTPAPSQSFDLPQMPPTPQRASPPERLSEKRRREEDEEDELVKLSLSHSKRRSSFSSTASSPSTSPHALLRRKRSFTSPRDPGPKKIAISLAIKSGGGDKAAGNEGS
ncbi:MAG: Platinum sensitivity protein [Trizodia sp. TS-e1964]|nr:MAG: Platinum sensitivity protein [Trizodia sp. TS-e1964]